MSEKPKPLTPLDYPKLLKGGDGKDADYWRKRKKPDKPGGPPGAFITGPILKHSAVQKLALAFGVRVVEEEWLDRQLGNELLCTCKITVAGYSPVTPERVGEIFGTAPVELDADWPVPESTTQIGEVNEANAGFVGRQYPHAIAQKRAQDRADLDHLGLFEHCGDVENPRFAQGADYEATPAEAPRERGRPEVSLADLKALPKDVQALSKTLGKLGSLNRSGLEEIYTNCGGDAAAIRDALSDIEEREGLF